MILVPASLYVASCTRAFEESWIQPFTDSRIHGFTDSRIHGCTDSRMHGFKHPRIHAFKHPRLHGFKHPRIHGFKDSVLSYRHLGVASHVRHISPRRAWHEGCRSASRGTVGRSYHVFYQRSRRSGCADSLGLSELDRSAARRKV
eukprot:scaffold442_cov268-Pinguiococcus_pyrenoidosus.AAC.101